MAISGSVTATFQGARDVYFRARQVFAGGGQTGTIYANPWTVVVGDPLFGYAPTLDALQRPVAGFGQLADNLAKGDYNLTSWQFGNQSLNTSPGTGASGGVLIDGAIYDQWTNGDVGSWRAVNGAVTINPTVGGLVPFFSAPTLALVGGIPGAVVQLYAAGEALFVSPLGQSVLPTFWDVTDEPPFGGVIFDDQCFLMATNSGLAQRVLVTVDNGVEQIRRYMYLDSPSYNAVINDPLYSSACVFSFSNGYMIARSPYIPAQLIVINGDCSKWWIYNCRPVDRRANDIFVVGGDAWGQYFTPLPIMSPLGFLTMTGFAEGASPDIYSSYVMLEVNPNTIANPGRRLPLANCWNCLPNAQGHR